MYHSITFTNASEDDLNTGGFTETSTGLLLNGVNTWDEWHLIPSSRPTIAMPGVSEKYIEIPGRDGSIDLSDWLAGRPIYGDRQGSLEFYHQNGYEDWETVRRAMAHYFHGRTLKMILEDDPAYYYEGRFKLNEWKSEASHSKVVIDYRLKPYKWHVRPQIAESQPFDGFGLERDYDNYFYIHEFQWSTLYLVDQFVKYENRIYRCTTEHTTGTGDNAFDETKWQRIYRFDQYTGYIAWAYVVHEGKVYISNKIHPPGKAWNSNDWNLVYQSFFYWRPIPQFYIPQDWYAGQYVQYNGRVYCLKRDWKANSDFSEIDEYWDIVIDHYKHDGHRYYKGDYVYYNNGVKGAFYQFTHDYEITPWQDSYWTKIEEYVTGKGYTRGTDVIYNGAIQRFGTDYRTKQWSDSYWTQIRNYSSSETYKAGDYVMYNQEIYLFNEDYSEKDGESWRPEIWTKMVAYYVSGQKYYSGNLVMWEGNIYKFNDNLPYEETSQYGFTRKYYQYLEGSPYQWSDSYWTKVEEYSSYSYYAANSYVHYNGSYYRFTNLPAPGIWYGYDYWDDNWWDERVSDISVIPEYSSAGDYAADSYIKWNGDIYRFNRDWRGPDYWNPDWWIETPAIAGEIDLKGLAGVRVKASYNNPIGQGSTNTRGALSVVYTGSTPIDNTVSIEGYRRMDEMNDSFRVCTINTPTHIEIRGGQL